MQLAQSKLQKVKLALYAIIALCTFITWCITISIIANADGADGRVDWYFALCFLTIPALVYLVAVPFWSRSQRFANAYAFAVIDAVWIILWLSAFASMISWNRAGILQGAIDKKIDDASKKTCDIFAYGSPQACSLGYSVVGFGVVIFLLFIGTTVISVMYVRKARNPQETSDPWLANTTSGSYNITHGGAGDASNLEGGMGLKDDAWDHNTTDIDNPFNHEDDAHADRLPDHQAENPYGSGYGRYGGYGTETDDGRHPGQPWNTSAISGSEGTGASTVGVDTEYHGGSSSYHAPSALSPTGHHSPHLGSRPGNFGF